MAEVCPECHLRPVRTKGLCNPCYKRLIWRPGPAGERERAASRAYKERNRAAMRAYYRRYDEERKQPCDGCGTPISRHSTTCKACLKVAADARADRIVEMYEAGSLLREIAEAVGTSLASISVDLDRLRKAGRIGYRYKGWEQRSVAS